MGIEDKKTEQFPLGKEYFGDIELRNLEILLNESLYAGNPTEEKAKNLEKFNQGVQKIMRELLVIAKSNPPRLTLILQFVRSNMLMLDGGGLAHGRSLQYEILLKLFHHFEEHYPAVYREVVK